MNKKYSPQLKAKVVIEAIQGQKSAAQVCRENNIAQDLLSRWKQTFLERASLLFVTSKVRSEEQRRIEELERLVGKLTFELELSKKVLSLSASPRDRKRSW